MEQRKKRKVLFHTDYCGAPTGFGGFAKELLEYLYKTDKYELFLYSCGSTWENGDYARWPWKVYGAAPNNQQEINNWLSQFPQEQHGFKIREMQYGSLNIDRIIHEIKPDVYIFNQDFWGGNYCFDRKWWNKINCVYNWTLDSIPILDDAQNNAHKIKYHYVWADFGVREFKKLAKKQGLNQEKIDAYNRVKLLRGTVNTKSYKRLLDQERLNLRKKYNIKPDDFCIGFLSRNQLRKLIPNLFEGYKLFKQQNPQIKNTKLLLFTHYGEGWDIPRLVRELEINNDEILACYKCRKTGEFFVLPFIGQDIDNPLTGDKKSLVTVNLGDSLSNEQVNQWYNLLDTFCLPITSGGQERAAQEAKLCELITIINPYSCFEDSCVDEAYSLVLEQSFNREIGTQFIKASPYPSSIAKQLKKVYEMPENKRREWGKKAREWVLNNFSIEVIGKQYEDLIDSLPEHNWDFIYPVDIKNPAAPVDFNIQDDYEFVNFCYKNVLNMHDMNKEKDEVQHWLRHLSQPKDKLQLRQELVQIFKNVAAQKNAEVQQIPFDSLLLKNDKKQFLLVCPQSAGDILYASSLLKSLRESYKSEEWNIYFACLPEFFELLDCCPYIDKILPYQPFMDSEIMCLGQGTNKGFFQGYSFLTVDSQKFLSYLGNHNINLKLKD